MPLIARRDDESPDTSGTGASLIGTVLAGSYRIESVIGRGGMGLVYEARHVRLPRRLAIKIIPLSLAAEASAVARFEREARVTSELGHPHIVEILDFDRTEAGQPFLVMERLEGEDLRARIHRAGPMPVPKVAAILRQAAAALEAAHEAGVVHRDLKPSNVFLCQRGQRDDYVKLLDFGVAKLLGAKTGATSTGAAVGTPSYMSPEQARGQSDATDARADIYSLSASVYEMLAGRAPFAGGSIPETMFKVVYEAPTDLRKLRPELHAGLDEVVMRAMAKDPAERYATAGAFCDAFVARAGLQPLQAVPTEDRPTDWVAYEVTDVEPLAISEDGGPREVETRDVETGDVETGDVETGDVATAPPARPAFVGATVADSSDELAVPADLVAGTISGATAPAVPVVDRTTAMVGGAQEAVGPRAKNRTAMIVVASISLLLGGAVAVVAFVDRRAPTDGSPATAADVDARQTTGRRSLDAGGVADRGTSRPTGRRVAAAAATAGDQATSHPVATGAGPDGGRHAARRRRRARRPGLLRVVTTTHGAGGVWAEVTVDGRVVGQSPLSHRLRAGVHKLRVSRGGYRTIARRIVIRSGQTTRVILSLRKAP